MEHNAKELEVIAVVSRRDKEKIEMKFSFAGESESITIIFDSVEEVKEKADYIVRLAKEITKE